MSAAGQHRRSVTARANRARTAPANPKPAGGESRTRARKKTAHRIETPAAESERKQPPGADGVAPSGAVAPDGAPPDPGNGKAHKGHPRIRFKIRDLPLPVRAALEEKIRTDYHSARHTSKWLQEVHGHYISPQTISNHHRNSDTMLGAVSGCIVQSEAILKAAGKDQGRVNYALAALVQTSLFDMMVALRTASLSLKQAIKSRHRSEARRINKLEREGKSAKEVEEDDRIPAARAALNKAEAQAINIVARTIELMSKVMHEYERMDRERQEAKRAAKGARKGDAQEAREGGLSPEAEASIRAALLDVGSSHGMDTMSSTGVGA